MLTARSGSRLMHVQAPALHKAGALVMVEAGGVSGVGVQCPAHEKQMKKACTTVAPGLQPTLYGATP